MWKVYRVSFNAKTAQRLCRLLAARTTLLRFAQSFSAISSVGIDRKGCTATKADPLDRLVDCSASINSYDSMRRDTYLMLSLARLPHHHDRRVDCPRSPTNELMQGGIVQGYQLCQDGFLMTERRV